MHHYYRHYYLNHHKQQKSQRIYQLTSNKTKFKIRKTVSKQQWQRHTIYQLVHTHNAYLEGIINRNEYKQNHSVCKDKKKVSDTAESSLFIVKRPNSNKSRYKRNNGQRLHHIHNGIAEFYKSSHNLCLPSTMIYF